MSSDFDKSDLARLLALEHAFCSLALISASNFAFLANVKPSEAVRTFRESIESSLFDASDTPKDVKDLMRVHLSKLFDHVASMAKHADLGALKK